MDAEKLIQIKALRAYIPIGYTEGFRLLQEYKGDIARIVALLQEKHTASVIAKTRLSTEIITPVLIRNKYDTQKTISQLENEYRLINGIPHTETAYTLYRWQANKEYAINHISSTVATYNNLQRHIPFGRNVAYWYSPTDLAGLNAFHICVVALTEWLDYEYGEGFNYVLHYNTDLVAEQLEKVGLGKLAHALMFARNIAVEVEQKYPGNTLDAHMLRYNTLSEDEDYTQACHYFEAHQHLIVERLFDFIKTNVSKFP